MDVMKFLQTQLQEILEKLVCLPLNFLKTYKNHKMLKYIINKNI